MNNYKTDDLTNLNKDTLVSKANTQIEFRGKLDFLIAYIYKCQLISKQNSNFELAKNLEEVEIYVKKILECEVKNQAFSNNNLFGLSSQTIKEKSHKLYAKYHKENFEKNELYIELNLLRIYVRQAEVLCVKAFDKKRLDLISALNILSSAIHILQINSIK